MPVGLLFEAPLPRKIASLPVSCIAARIADGAAVPSMKTSWSLRFASTLCMPEEESSKRMGL